jgi:hypothetical protein
LHKGSNHHCGYDDHTGGAAAAAAAIINLRCGGLFSFADGLQNKLSRENSAQNFQRFAMTNGGQGQDKVYGGCTDSPYATIGDARVEPGRTMGETPGAGRISVGGKSSGNSGVEIWIRVTPGVEYVKVTVRGGRVVGALLIGDTGLEEVFENLIMNAMDVSAFGIHLLSPDLDLEEFFD